MGLGFIFDRLMGRKIRAVGATTVGTPSELGGSEGKVDRGGLSFTMRFMIADRPALVGLVLVVGFLVWAVMEGVAQALATYTGHAAYGWDLLPSNPLALNFNDKLLAPSLNHFPDLVFGTNYQGQSIFSRMMYAAPHDAVACLLVVGSAIVLGMLLGTTAGYFGGWTDEVLMRVTDAFLSLPALVLAITVSVLLGSGFESVLIALVIVWWPTYARIFRGQALTIRSKAYVEASKMSGAGSARILAKHVFPNAVDPIIAIATLDLGTVILTFAVLAFLGIGSPFYPEWGAESSAGLGYFPGDWWWSVMPGLVIMIVVVAFTLVGDRIQDLVGGRITY
jgi:peptide/nickel transport system permease protein